MGAIDFIILILGAISLLAGYRKGLLGQLGAIIGLIAAVAAARLLTQPALTWLNDHGYLLANQSSQWSPTQYMPKILVSILIFIIVFFVAKLIFNYTRLFFESLSLGFVNRMGGALFSLFIAMFCLSLFLNFCQYFKKDGWIVEGSTLGGGKLAASVMSLAPKTLGTAVDFWNGNGKNADDTEPN